MIVLDAPIQRVIIYADRARVIRQGRIQLHGGESKISIPMLPISLDENSVRATSLNPAVQIIDVDILTEQRPRNMSPELAALQAQYEQIAAADEELADEDFIEEERLAFFVSLRESASDAMSKGFAFAGFSLENIKALIDYISAEQRRSIKRRREIAIQRLQLSQQMKDLQAQTPHLLVSTLQPNEETQDESEQEAKKPRSIRSPFGRHLFISDGNDDENNDEQDDDETEVETPFLSRKRSIVTHQKTRTIQLTVFAETEGEYEFSVSYMVSEVSWQPFYDIRVSTENDYAISFLAEIQQNTGEHWLDVPISLSTARPNQDADVPRIRPWLIEAAPKPSPLTRRTFFGRPPSNNDDSRSSSPFGRRSSPPVPPSPFRRAASSSNAEQKASQVNLDQELEQISGAIPTMTYEVAQPLRILSGETPTKAFIANYQLEGQLEMMAIPEQSETAFLCARLKNTTEQTILGGTALIFFGTHFVGKIQLDTIAPRRSFMVQLGDQPHVRIQRELEKHSSESLASGDKCRTEFIYRITVFNDGNAPVQLVVYDHIPLARHKDISVLVRAIVPQPSVPHNPNNNIFEWRLEIPPQSHQKITLGFALDHPHDMKIVSKRN